MEAESEANSRYRQAGFVHKGSSTARYVAIGVVILIAVSTIGVVAFRPAAPSSKALTVGMMAPNFTLQATSGSSFTLSSYRGRSFVLLFFNEGLSCAPCLQQMTALDQLSPQFASLNITAASITTDQLSQLKEWADTNGPRQSVVMSDSSRTVSADYDMLGGGMHPGMAAAHTFVIIDKSGIMTWRHDYYPPAMYVDNSQLISDIRQATGA